MRRTVTTTTVQTSTFQAGTETVQDVTVLLVRMNAQQISEWKWVGDADAGTDPVEGWEVRDTTGALLGQILPLGHMARRLYVQWYDPEQDDFYAAGETPHAVLTQGVHRILECRTLNVAEVPTGEGFDLDEPRYLLPRMNCWTGMCPEDCPECATDPIPVGLLAR